MNKEVDYHYDMNLYSKRLELVYGINIHDKEHDKSMRDFAKYILSCYGETNE